MQKIIPLKYKVRLWLKDITPELKKDYINPNYMKKFLEDFFPYNIWSNEIKVKHIQWKKIWLEEDVIYDNFNKKHLIIVKFKAGNPINKEDNWKVIKDDIIIQTISKEWDLLTDFFTAIDISYREDSKYFFIEWKILTITKWNEQIKAQIEYLFRQIYPQKDWEYNVDFIFEEKEIKNTMKQIKWLELVWKAVSNNGFNHIEKWVKLKETKITVSITWFIPWVSKSFFEKLKLNKIFDNWEYESSAIVSSWKSRYKSKIDIDNLKFALKNDVIHADESISFDDFVDKTYEYLYQVIVDKKSKVSELYNKNNLVIN